jgi:hypothetical protein
LRKLAFITAVCLALFASGLASRVFSQETKETETKLDAGILLEGEIGGAKYRVLVPEKWNGRILMRVRGQISPTAPLVAELDANDYPSQIKAGWIVASTSFSRNDFGDNPMADIDNLRNHIVKKYGEAKMVIVEGGSAGGAITLMMAERGGNGYSGFISVSYGSGPTFNYKPKLPVIFLANQNELDFATEYLKKLGADSVKPALWRVSRDGHCNILREELDIAREGVVKWLETKEIELTRDVTLNREAAISKATIAEGKATAKITEVDSSWGNLDTEFVASDLEALGIKKGDFFSAAFEEKVFKVYYGSNYSDVPKGEWIAFVTADGPLRIARCFANAAEAAGCKKGDSVTISKAK